MKQMGCQGQCDQGRRACPTPEICSVEDIPKRFILNKVVDLLIAIALGWSIIFVIWALV